MFTSKKKKSRRITFGTKQDVKSELVCISEESESNLESESVKGQ